jgi:hypothetical protein
MKFLDVWLGLHPAAHAAFKYRNSSAPNSAGVYNPYKYATKNGASLTRLVFMAVAKRLDPCPD